MGSSKDKSTKQNLIDHSIKLFGKYGVDNVSTRKIASCAKANISLISYYFSGKEGLFAACIQHLAEQSLKRIQPLRQKINSLIESGCEDKNIWKEILKEYVNASISHILSDKYKYRLQLFIMVETNKSKIAEKYFEEVWWPERSDLIKIISKISNNQSSDILDIKFMNIVGMIRFLLSGVYYVPKTESKKYNSSEFLEKYVDYIIKTIEVI